MLRELEGYAAKSNDLPRDGFYFEKQGLPYFITSHKQVREKMEVSTWLFEADYRKKDEREIPKRESLDLKRDS